MRIQINVQDLTPLQWRTLKYFILPEYDMAPNVVRVCVEFTGGPEHVHVEMPVRVFMFLMTQLQRVQAHDEIAKTADMKLCEHGAQVIMEKPSAFPSAKPIRFYMDGCQSYGPYESVERS